MVQTSGSTSLNQPQMKFFAKMFYEHLDQDNSNNLKRAGRYAFGSDSMTSDSSLAEVPIRLVNGLGLD